MACVISLLGFQPSAPAAAIKTWSLATAQTPTEILLLATRNSIAARVPHRLVRYLKTLFPVVRGTIITISDSLVADAHAPAAAEAVCEWMTARNTAPTEPLVFCGDPGPKFLVVSVARVLPPDAVFLHADTEAVHWGRHTEVQWQRRPVQDLGLQTLLDFYDLRIETDPRTVPPALRSAIRRCGVSVPPRVIRGLRFAGLQLPPLQLAYERGGWLYGLLWIENAAALQQVRDALRMSHELRHLQPVLAVCSHSPAVLARVRAARLQALPLSARTRLARWIRGRAQPPGHEIITDLATPARRIRACRGRGGAGAPLVVWVGTDASATLLALCTHRPTQAWLLYDATTPAAVETALRLRDCRAQLPVGEITFVPSDLLGRGTTATLPQLIAAAGHVRADVSPGRKAQGCALAQVRELDLWSLRPGTGQAAAFTGDRVQPLVGPDILTQAKVNGGPLRDPGEDACRWLSRVHDGHVMLAAFVAARIAEAGAPVTLAPLRDMECARGRLQVRGESASITLDGRSVRVQLATRGGYWFEDVVASTFARGGADEVRVGVKWRWPRAMQQHLEQQHASQRVHKDEVDVIARFAHRFCVVSCKSGTPPDLDKEARQIEAVAARCISRFALPILLCPWIPADARAESLTRESGAVLLDAAAIAQPALLRALLDRLFARRSTLGS